MKHTKRYIDDKGVERGYYVYAHYCKKTGDVFYVGKGYGKRAWSNQRSDAWHERVDSLPEGYEVKLLHTDCSDYESQDLERSEIANNGGCAAEGGTLVNWLPCDPGAFMGVGFGIAIPSNPELVPAEEATEAAYPRFKPYDKKKSYELVNTWEEIAGDHWDKFYAWFDAKYQPDDSDEWPDPPDIFDTFQNDVANIVELKHDFCRRKIDYEFFTDNVESYLQFLWTTIEECNEETHKKRVRPLIKAIEKWYYQFANNLDKDAKNDFYWEEVAKIKGFKNGREACLASLTEAKKAFKQLDISIGELDPEITNDSI